MLKPQRKPQKNASAHQKDSSVNSVSRKTGRNDGGGEGEEIENEEEDLTGENENLTGENQRDRISSSEQVSE